MAEIRTGKGEDMYGLINVFTLKTIIYGMCVSPVLVREDGSRYLPGMLRNVKIDRCQCQSQTTR